MVPSSWTTTWVASWTCPPVSNSGKLEGVMVSKEFGLISKLSKCPGCDNFTKLSPGTAVIIIFPPGAERLPRFKTLLPNNPSWWLWEIFKLPKFTIAPLPSKRNTEGLPINSAQLLLPKASNQPWLNPIPLAVVAIKSAGIFRVAFGPNTIPAGFIKNKLAFPPVTWIKPLIIEALPPVTRLKILIISGFDWKVAICP